MYDLWTGKEIKTITDLQKLSKVDLREMGVNLENWSVPVIDDVNNKSEVIVFLDIANIKESRQIIDYIKDNIHQTNLYVFPLTSKESGLDYLKNIYFKKNVVYFSFTNADLKISINPNFSYMTFEKRMLSNEMERHFFIDFLRSRIRNSKLLSFEQLGFERTAKLTLEKNDEIGTKHLYEIYIDIMGKHSNIIIVEDNKILDAFKRIATRYRNILPGEKFKLFTSSKINPKTDLDKLINLPKNFEGKISEFIYKNIQGFSKITANEVLFRANLEDRMFSEDDFLKIFKVIRELLEEFEQNNLYIYYEKNNPVEISAFKLNHLGLKYRTYVDVSLAISEYFEWIEQKSYLFQLKKSLENIVVNKISKLENVLGRN